MHTQLNSKDAAIQQPLRHHPAPTKALKEYNQKNKAHDKDQERRIWKAQNREKNKVANNDMNVTIDAIQAARCKLPILSQCTILPLPGSIASGSVRYQTV